MIKPPMPPPEVLDAVRGLLPQLDVEARTTGDRTTHFVAQTSRAVAKTPPLRVYDATLEDVLQRRILASARAVAWRCPAGSAAAEVSEREGTWQLAAYAESPRDLTAALARAGKLQGDFEPRLLRIPAVYADALWLRSDAGDILIPLDTAEPCDEETFTNELRSLAEKRILMR